MGTAEDDEVAGGLSWCRVLRGREARREGSRWSLFAIAEGEKGMGRGCPVRCTGGGKVGGSICAGWRRGDGGWGWR
jgi:hypothetical protein